MLGGGGWVGYRLTARLAAAGWDVTALVLPGSPPVAEARTVYGYRRERATLARLATAEPDVLVDLVAYEPADTRALVEAAVGRVGWVVHLSSVAAYCRIAAREEEALRFGGEEGGYGPGKAACERVLEGVAPELPATILRAPPIVGPGDPASRERYFAERILAGRPILHPGPLEGRVWMLGVEDLATALAQAAVRRPDSPAMHLAQPDAPTLAGHVEALARALDRPSPLLRLASHEQLRRAQLRLYGFPYVGLPEIAPDVSRANEALGWRPAPYAELIAAIAAELRPRRQRGRSAWPGCATRQAALAGVHPWLHAEAEARALAGAPVEAPPADALLAAVTGDPTAALAVDVGDLGAEAARPLDGRAAEGPPRIALPRALGERWSGPVPSSGGAGPLVAIVEPDPADSAGGWLLRATPDHGSPHYGADSTPLRLSWGGVAAGLTASPGRGERLVLDWSAAEDRRQLATHLRACQQAGALDLEDLAAWSRIYVARTAHWLPPTGGAPWILSHAVARLLVRAGLTGPATLWMHQPKPTPDHYPHLPTGTCLCDVAGQSLIADLRNDRLLHLPAPVASVLRPN